jgi:hypothetical protein
LSNDRANNRFDVSEISETWKFAIRIVLNDLNVAKRLNRLNDLNGLGCYLEPGTFETGVGL